MGLYWSPHKILIALIHLNKLDSQMHLATKTFTSNYLKLTTRMRTLSCGQWDCGAICSAKLSLPSDNFPILQATKPPFRLRQALPDPTLSKPDKYRNRSFKVAFLRISCHLTQIDEVNSLGIIICRMLFWQFQLTTKSDLLIHMYFHQRLIVLIVCKKEVVST